MSNLGLETDLNNKNFQGAVANPDDMMHVDFYMHAPIDKWASEEAGKVIRRAEIAYVRIMRPGDKDTILEIPVREDHKARWPQKWLYFAMKNGLEEGAMDFPGWKLEEWPELAEQQELLRDLQYARFMTVEQIAGASDAQIQRMGMAGPGLRERAKRALIARGDEMTQKAIAERDIKIDEQAGQIAELSRNMEKLMSMMQPANVETAPLPDDLVAQYTAKFGKAPHHRMKPETIRAELEAA